MEETDNVTPCVGVWIETPVLKSIYLFSPSHPAWVCGLKPVDDYLTTNEWKSHPAWVCGLKHVSMKKRLNASRVTPCVGVWIETPVP